MALGEQVKESLDEAQGNLRNALAYAARNERPTVCTQISELISKVDQIGSFDNIFDKLENYRDDYKNLDQD